MKVCSVEDCRNRVFARQLCSKHYRRLSLYGDAVATKREPVEERFWRQVEKSSGCWIWHGPMRTGGYGLFACYRDGHRFQLLPHRFSFEKLVGPIPEGLQLDHLCRNRACVNPEHLEPVTGRENQMRSPITVIAINSAKTHCVHGHEFTPENTHVRKRGSRECRTCMRDRERIRRASA